MWTISQAIKKNILFLSSILFPSYCYVCSKEGNSFCNSCLKKIKRAVDSPSPYIVSIYSFKDPIIKKAIHAIKYFHRKDLISPLSQELADEILKKEFTSYVLVPVPMPNLRKYIRGYNHSEAIARAVAKQTNLPIKNDLLRRTSSNKRQVITSSRSERLRNQKNTFTVTRALPGMNIILIDDVTTTGATLLEARKVLLQAGASSVRAFTVAH